MKKGKKSGCGCKHKMKVNAYVPPKKAKKKVKRRG
jgi:hypothetical protein